MDTSEAVITTANCEAFDYLPDPVAVLSARGKYEHFNKAWKAQAVPLGNVFTSNDWVSCIHEDDRQALEAFLYKDYSSTQVIETELRIGSPSSGYEWFLLRSAPHANEYGKIVFRLHILTNLHAKKEKEIFLHRTARERDALLNASSDCIKLINLDGTLAHMNSAGCTALCVDPNSGFGMEWLPLLPPEISEPGLEALDQARNGVCNQFLGMSQAPGEDPRYWQNRLTPHLSPDGKVEAIVCVSRDVTSAHQAEQRIGILLREVSHRARNMLTVIRALIRRTVPDPQEEFVSILDKRITSIARSQDLLVDDQWRGATIRQVVCTQTVTVKDEQSGRLHVEGDPTIRLRPDSAEKIGLAIHELTTNAIRHGAFSNDVGSVFISWKIEKQDDERVFSLRWKEKGGPTIIEPVRKGFGAALIERNPRGVQGSTVTYRSEEDGVLWEFSAPACNVLSPHQS